MLRLRFVATGGGKPLFWQKPSILSERFGTPGERSPFAITAGVLRTPETTRAQSPQLRGSGAEWEAYRDFNRYSADT